MKLKRVLVINGPNLDMLGSREPEVYGDVTLGNLEYEIKHYGESLGIKVNCFQSNSEGKLIKKIHAAPHGYDALIYNPGAHAHYSYALRDAIASIEIPVVEVHLTKLEERESFRHFSVIEPACIEQISGLGIAGYCRALDALCAYRPGKKAKKKGKAQADSHPKASQLKGHKKAASRRLKRLRACLQEENLAGIFLRDTPTIEYLSAFDDVFDEEQAHALLVTPTSAKIHSDMRYTNALRAAAKQAGGLIEVFDEGTSHVRFAKDHFAHSAGKLGFEDSLPYSEFVSLVDNFTTKHLSPTSNLVLKLRAVKDDGEVQRMKAAQALTDAAFSFITTVIRPGMTERDVQLELEHYLFRRGAQGLAFSTIVSCGPHAADPHATPGDTLLEAGQCVVLDFGARYGGYCSDMTRTIFLGAPTGEMASAWEAIRQANESVEALLEPGVTGAEMHAHAEEVLAKAGFAGKMGHGLGHGVGIEVHELPVLSPRNTKPLVAGNVVSVEPGIYIPGSFGMRLEDVGLVTPDGFDVFTQSTHETVIL